MASGTQSTGTYQRKPDPAVAFRFQVTIDSATELWFTECTGMDVHMEPASYKEGGLNSHAHKFPAPFEVGNITLKKGVTSDGPWLWNWIKDMINGTIAVHSITISLLDPTSTVIQSWTFQNAFPIKWSATPLGTNSTDIVIEEFSFAHQGFLFSS